MLTWNRSKKRVLTGETIQMPRPEQDWMRVDVPDLRIVSEDLALACDARRTERKARYLAMMDGKQLRRPVTPSGRFLLTGGLLRCSCGANFEGVTRPNGRQAGNVYGCAARRRMGRAACSNDILLDIPAMDAAVLDALLVQALHPRLVDLALDSPASGEAGDRQALEAERAELRARVANYATAIGMGGDIPALVESLRQAEARIRAIEGELAPRDQPDRASLREAMLLRVGEWKSVLRAHGPQTKEILHHLIDPIVIDSALLPEPVHVIDDRGTEDLSAGDYVDWVTAVRPECLLNGYYNRVASPAGFGAASTLEERAANGKTAGD